MQSAKAGGPLASSVLPHLEQEDMTPMVVLQAQLKELCQDGLRRLVALDHAILVKEHHVPCRQWHQLSSGTALFLHMLHHEPCRPCLQAIRLQHAAACCLMALLAGCHSASRLSHGPAQVSSNMPKVQQGLLDSCCMSRGAVEHVCTLLLTNRSLGHELQLGMRASLHDLSNPGTTEHELEVHISVCVVFLVLLQAQLTTSMCA